MTEFMRRWNFSNKLPSTLEKTQKLAASDPEIYNFYDILEKRISELDISNRPECFWNLDETNLFIDAQNEKVAN